MRLGSATLTLVSDGIIRMDGGAMFGVVPKVIWNRSRPADRRNRVEMGLDAMNARKLVSNLAPQGLTPEDIHIVALSHLHFDHAGGSTRYNRRGQLETDVFPTPHHLPVHYLTAFDMYPLATLEAKGQWLQQYEINGNPSSEA